MTATAAGLVGALLLLPCAASAQALRAQGQLSTWFVANDQEPARPMAGLRYIPQLNAEQTLRGERILDAEVSLNGYAVAEAPAWAAVDTASRLKPYRMWARFKTSRFEARVGLQKINFGSATLLRPLMWFDSVDPRDPLQITDGVYGALLRQYLPNNVTVWGWGLYGNTRTKGWEIQPSADGRPEFGARVQIPMARGEAAFSTHHRQVDFSKGFAPVAASAGDPVAPERRYAVDGKWDLGIGVWFEGVLTDQADLVAGAADQRALNVGADYTFAAGNGLYVLGEYFVLDTADERLGANADARLAAVTARYPVSLLDSLSVIVYVDTQRHDAYRFVNWQRTYDRWQFYVMGFWNPRERALYQGGASRSGQSPMTGRGIQLMAVFNH